MGAEESIPNQKQFGFRIYKLISNGPLESAGLHELSDFIIPPEEIVQNKKPFSEWLKGKAGEKVQLLIYSLLTRKEKQYEIQTNTPESKDGILGASVRFENYANAHRKLLHVTKVNDNSFSKTQLSLHENDDYLIAMRPDKGEIMSLNSDRANPLELFAAMIKYNIGKECEFFIYSKTKGPRAVKAKIDNDEFFTIGCEAAFGKLHEFPIETIEDDEENKKLKEEAGETQYI